MFKLFAASITFFVFLAIIQPVFAGDLIKDLRASMGGAVGSARTAVGGAIGTAYSMGGGAYNSARSIGGGMVGAAHGIANSAYSGATRIGSGALNLAAGGITSNIKTAQGVYAAAAGGVGAGIGLGQRALGTIKTCVGTGLEYRNKLSNSAGNLIAGQVTSFSRDPNAWLVNNVHVAPAKTGAQLLSTVDDSMGGSIKRSMPRLSSAN